MLTNFCEQLWIDFDLEVAVFIENLVSWIRYNSIKSNPEHRNYHKERFWSYDTYQEMSKRFKGFSPKTIRTIINRCVKHDLIIVDNFNKKKYDNTNWYTLTDKALEYYPMLQSIFLEASAQSGRPSAQSGRPIPEQHNSLSNINNITNSVLDNDGSPGGKSDYQGYHEGFGEGGSEGVESTEDCTRSDYRKNHSKNRTDLPNLEQNLESNQDNRFARVNARKSGGKGNSTDILMPYINAYREIFPDNPQPHKRVISTSLQKTLLTLIQKWPELDPNGKSLTVSTFRRYLEQLRLCAPKFSLGEYETSSGNRRKNSLETFARWNTVVKFLENQYS